MDEVLITQIYLPVSHITYLVGQIFKSKMSEDKAAHRILQYENRFFAENHQAQQDKPKLGPSVCEIDELNVHITSNARYCKINFTALETVISFGWQTKRNQTGTGPAS